MNSAIFAILFICAVGVNSECWWSGCQPRSWGERGCFPSSSWHQTDSKPCDNGDMFHCCSGGSSGGGGGGGGGGAQGIFLF